MRNINYQICDMCIIENNSYHELRKVPAVPDHRFGCQQGCRCKDKRCPGELQCPCPSSYSPIHHHPCLTACMCTPLVGVGLHLTVSFSPVAILCPSGSWGTVILQKQRLEHCCHLECSSGWHAAAQRGILSNNSWAREMLCLHTDGALMDLLHLLPRAVHAGDDLKRRASERIGHRSGF